MTALLLTLCAMKTILSIARFRVLPVLALASLIFVAACGGDDDGYGKEKTGEIGADARIATHSKGNAPTLPGSKTVAGIAFTPPTHWRDLEASGMRQAQFRLPPVQGESEEAEVNVFYFGPQSGGGVQANLERWIGQMELPEGADPGTAITRSTFTADGMNGHLVSLDGTYMKSARPMGGEKTPHPGYRLVGVVLEGPQGSLFFKLTGPEKTARAMESDLMKMVQAAVKA